MILGYLIFAHLLGDFIFQPSRLVTWKISSKWGILVHSLIHLALLTLAFLPYLLNKNFTLLIALAFVAVCHFFIDQGKINYDLKHDNKVAPFLIDQLLHLITIAIAASFIMKSVTPLPRGHYYELYSDPRLVIFLSALVCVSTVMEVFYYQKKRQKNPGSKFHPNFRHMLIRTLIFTLGYALLLALVPYL